MPGAKRDRSLCILRIWIFDVRGFIQNHRGEFHGAKLTDVPAQDWIARQDDVGFRNSAKQSAPCGTLDPKDFEFRHEFLGLPRPVKNQRRGTDNQGWTLERAKESQSLQSLTKPHLICQNPAKTVSAQETHPVHTFLLVRPQYPLQRTERLRLGRD